ncbi:MAG: ParB/RepB/Spo0J family partition protein [Clostridia bacterium]|jgi:ParB family chromosome partitioning protein
MTNEYLVHEIPIEKIFSDEEFNCRGHISKLDVTDLARDIDSHGLQFPIAVQPRENSSTFPEEYDYRIIAGHRRFSAFIVLGRKTIPAMIKTNLSELQARLLNLAENLKREELDILQEAKAVKKLRDLGLTQDNIAYELGMSRGWVQVRFNLLELPVEIQNEAAAGILNQSQIRQIHSLPTKEDQYEAVKKIKNSKLKGVRGLDVSNSAKDKPFVKKRQSKNSVQDMIDHLGKTVGFGLHTRCLAWANGAINSAELHFDIKHEMDKQGKEYDISFLTKGNIDAN